VAQLVRSTPPPLWLVRHVVNPLLRRLLPGLLGRLLPGMAVLRFRGRRTGTAYAVPIGIYDHQGVQVVFTESAWAANFRGGAPVEIVRRGRSSHGHGELVTDPAAVGPAIRSVLAGGTSQRMIGIAVEAGHQPTDDELAAVRRAVLLRPAPAG